MCPTIECECNCIITNFKFVKFEMNGSMIELECNICHGLIGWWYRPTKKIMPLKKRWSKKECLAMR